jgi:hypothetical protein
MALADRRPIAHPMTQLPARQAVRSTSSRQEPPPLGGARSFVQAGRLVGTAAGQDKTSSGAALPVRIVWTRAGA